MPSLHAGDIDLHYEDVGAGPVIVLVHGAASSARCFRDVIPTLTKSYRVVAPDLRGMGRSGRVTAMAPDAWTTDLALLLDALKIERAHLCGTSLAARIVLRHACLHPQRVATLALDAPILHPSAAGDTALEALFGAPPAPFAAELSAWNGEDWRIVTENFLKLRRIPGLQEHLSFTDSELENLGVPAFVCRGDIDDPIHPLLDAIRIYRLIGRGQCWIAPGTRFTALRGQPEEFCRAYDAFIRAFG